MNPRTYALLLLTIQSLASGCLAILALHVGFGIMVLVIAGGWIGMAIALRAKDPEFALCVLISGLGGLLLRDLVSFLPGLSPSARIISCLISGFFITLTSQLLLRQNVFTFGSLVLFLISASGAASAGLKGSLLEILIHGWVSR